MTVKSLHSGKTLGLDGFQVEFFKTYAEFCKTYTVYHKTLLGVVLSKPDRDPGLHSSYTVGPYFNMDAKFLAMLHARGRDI